MTVDVVDHFQEIVAGHAGPVAEHFAEPHRAELRGVDGLDQVAVGQHDFGAAAADIGDGRVLVGQIETARCTLKKASRPPARR